MAPRVFIASSTFADLDPRPLSMMQEAGLTVACNQTKKRLDRGPLIDQARGAEAVVAGLEIYDAPVLEALADLKCISRCGVGVDNIDLTAAGKKGIKVFITPDAVVQPVAELTLAVILDLLRQISLQNASMHQGQWQRITGRQLAGKTAGVIGLGRIGRRVAQILSGLGVKVCAYDVAPDKNWMGQHGVALVSLDRLLAQADIVTLHLAALRENPFLLTKRHLQSMKKDALLINLARGSFVDEGALVEVLKEGHLAGAALDVFQQEPYAGPLCAMGNVILTPHVATLTQESRAAMEIEAARNVIGFFK